MLKVKDIPLVEYTRAEEALNCITHAAGLVIVVLIEELCIKQAVKAGDVFAAVCAGFYLLGTAAAFLASAVYHALKPSDKKRIMRLVDHCMIFFAVAGTVTGCVPAVKATAGIFPALLMLLISWGGAIAGLIVCIRDFEGSKAVQMTLYIAVSAVCACCGLKAYFVLPPEAFYCFCIGSAALLAGALIYGKGKKIRYMHSVFHVCVLLGLGIYFYGIYNYVYCLL